MWVIWEPKTGRKVGGWYVSLDARGFSAALPRRKNFFRYQLAVTLQHRTAEPHRRSLTVLVH